MYRQAATLLLPLPPSRHLDCTLSHGLKNFQTAVTADSTSARAATIHPRQHPIKLRLAGLPCAFSLPTGRVLSTPDGIGGCGLGGVDFLPRGDSRSLDDWA